ncbi:MAG: 2-oxo acid dehydrogenase subunit E2, partial [Chitinophagales bacterium]
NQMSSIECNISVAEEKRDLPNKTKNLEAGDTYVEFDRMRGIIARLMSESKSKSAHCTSFSEVDVTSLVTWRDQIKDAYQAKYASKVTYTHLLMFLIIESLRAFPKINAHSSEEGYILKSNINLGFATALPDGNLIVPNIKGIQDLSFQKIVEQVGKIGQEAKLSNLKPDDIQNGSFTMSNTGIFGSLMGTPIINQPQVAIMSLGEIIKTPAVVERNGQDYIEVRKKMILSLSYDHRIIDGAYAASFLTNYKKRIENFKGLQF